MSDLTPIVAPDDFPASRKSVYLNTASVCLMYSGAERAVVEWMHDLAENGTIHFDEAAEERAFATLHASAARLFSCRPEEIAVGSSATELLDNMATDYRQLYQHMAKSSSSLLPEMTAETNPFRNRLADSEAGNDQAPVQMPRDYSDGASGLLRGGVKRD